MDGDYPRLVAGPRPVRRTRKNLGGAASRCTREQCLAVIDEAFKRFETDKPGNRVTSLTMDMQIDGSLWGEVLGAARETLSGMRGRNPGGPFFPDEVIKNVLRVGENSATIEELKALLAGHHLAFKNFGFAQPPTLRGTLAGRRWSEIARLPDAGIGVPPVIDVDLY
jgi:hypothetical protein